MPPQPTAPQVVMPVALPRATDLVKKSIALYKSRHGIILRVASIQFGLGIVGGIVLGAVTTLLSLATGSVGVAVGLVFGVGFLIYLVVSLWCTAAMMHAFLDPGIQSAQEALSRAKQQLPAVVRVALLSLVFLGLVPVLCLAVGYGILFVVPALSPLVVIVFGIGALIYIAIVSLKIAFSTWAVVANRAQGIAAFKFSAELTRGRLRKLFNLFFAVGLYVVLAYIGMSIVVGIVSVLAPKIIGQIVSQAVSVFLISPLLIGANSLLFGTLTSRMNQEQSTETVAS